MQKYQQKNNPQREFLPHTRIRSLILVKVDYTLRGVRPPRSVPSGGLETLFVSMQPSSLVGFSTRAPIMSC